MSGLGITLDHSTDSQNNNLMESLSRNGSNEALLPPLPQGEPNSPSLLRSTPLSASAASLNNSPSSVVGRPLNDSSIPYSRTSVEIANHPINDLNDFFTDHLFALYELDSPCLNIDKFPTTLEPLHSVSNATTPATALPPFHNFPHHSNSSPVIPTSSTLESQKPSGSSPMRRLRSFKNTIRKLSLLKINLTAANSAPPTPLSATDPIAHSGTPTRNTFFPSKLSSDEDGSYKSSASNSIKSSTFSSFQNHNPMVPTSACSCKNPCGHSHTVSLGLIPVLIASERKRTLSNPVSYTSMNTASPSPVIMLLENLNTSKKNLSELEQSFFNQMQSSGSGAQSHKRASSEELADSSLNGMERLKTSSDLIEYSLYLNEYKRSIEEAFDATKERLQSSGWCSSHDLETLSLQKDSSLSQIDTKLLQIEEKLNSQFNLSMLNNACNSTRQHHPQHHENIQNRRLLKTIDLSRAHCRSRENSMTPSLKALESRCFSFTKTDSDGRA